MSSGKHKDMLLLWRDFWEIKELIYIAEIRSFLDWQEMQRNISEVYSTDSQYHN